MKQKMVGGDEYNAYTSWRKVYCYLQRPGAVKKIKVRTHRRERRAARSNARAEVRDYTSDQ
jgi:hypothetical protein